MAAEAEVRLHDFKNIYSLSGKIAVITGGSRGLGLHAASGLLQAGCSKVYITSRKASACEAACAALNALPNKAPGAQAISVPADSAKVEEVERLVKEVAKTTDHVDILFANAGATWGEKFDTHPDTAFAKVMDLNVKSVFNTIRLWVFLSVRSSSFEYCPGCQELTVLILMLDLRPSSKRRPPFAILPESSSQLPLLASP